MELVTARLKLREWRDHDLDSYAALNADPRVREFFPNLATREESAESINYVRKHFQQHGFGMWAVEVIGGEPFIGFIGLMVPSFEAHFTPCVEIGWRLAFSHWGRGYATEGASAALAFGFELLDLPQIVALTTVNNERSRRVMKKLGMHHDPQDDFDHQNIAEGHPLRPHVLYRIQREHWDAAENFTVIGSPERRSIQIVEYDRRWPDEFQKHANRIARALGNAALGIEHIGSTSVPGLAAKPIIDVLVIVRDSADEAAYVPALEALGYELRVREPEFHEHRMLRTPAREVHIHVFSHDSPEVDRYLIFRDRLRHSPEDRHLYERTKRELAKREWAEMNDYADAKTDVIEAIIAKGGDGLRTTAATVIIRSVELSDAEAMADLMTLLGYATTPTEMHRRLTALLGESEYQTFVATITEQVVGMVGFYIGYALEFDGRYGQLTGLAVRPEFSRRGIGSSLMEYAEKWFMTQSVNLLIVTSGLHRHETHDFYRAIGYEQTGLRFAKRL